MVAPPSHGVSHMLSSKNFEELAEFDIHITDLSMFFDLTIVFRAHSIVFVLKVLVLDLIVYKNFA